TSKFGYIKKIREAFEWVELYFKKSLFTDDRGNFCSTCIETITPARLLIDLASSSKFLSSDEDGPLREMNFFNPRSKRAKQKQSIIINAYNGIYNHRKAMMTYARDIKDRSLTILVSTTGNQWCNILDYFSDSNATNGNTAYDKTLPSLEVLSVVRILLGFRIYEYSADAYAYLKPILVALHNNEASSEITTKVSLNNKREQALERRSADIIERIAFAIQTILDIFKIIDDIKPDIVNDIKIEFGQITKATRLQIEETIRKNYYINDNPGAVNDSIIDYPDDVDLLELDELFYCKLNTDEQSQKTNENEKKILQLPFNIIYTTQLVGSDCIFHNAKKRNIDVQQLLKNLVEKKILSSGMFLKTSGKNVPSWIRNLEFVDEKEFDKFKYTLLNDYGWTLEKYLEKVRQNAEYATSLQLTIPVGADKLNKQKQSIRLMDEQIMRTKEQRSQKELYRLDLHKTFPLTLKAEKRIFSAENELNHAKYGNK
ncbi:unnamed protein product, partial [Didymodactylos carnosus]